MGRLGRAIIAVLGGSLLAAGLPIICWLTGHHDTDSVGVSALGGILLASAFLGYQLRGFPHPLTWVLAGVVWVVSAIVLALLLKIQPAPPASLLLKSVLLSLATLGVLSLHYPHGLAVGLPSLWLFVILPTRLWQEFFEGWLGPPLPSKTEEANPA